MPIVRINAVGDRPELFGGGCPWRELGRQVQVLPPGVPIVVLIHGYKFAPGAGPNCPHGHILGLDPRRDARRAVSWPRHLGFGRGDAAEGLCIAFGWQARGTIWRAWNSAASAGRALSAVIARLAAAGRRPVDIVCHSLGARVALAALDGLPAGAVGRAMLLAAADYQSTALAAMDTPAGRTAEVVNITTRENDLFDALVEWLVRPPRRGDRALGSGLPAPRANWLDLQIDCPQTRDGLAGLGYLVPPPRHRICHWSPYLRPGLLALYRDLIRCRAALPLEHLRRTLPQTPAPRWSRLIDLPRPALAGLLRADPPPRAHG